MQTTKDLVPELLEAAQFTLTTSRGNLKLVTQSMFETFAEVERAIKSHLQDGRHIYLRDSFEKIVSKISKLHLLPVSCESHPETLPQLIMDYVLIHFHFEARRYRNINFSKVKTAVHTSKKRSTCVNTKETTYMLISIYYNS